MNLLPYHRVSIHIPQSPASVIAALDPYVEAPRLRLGLARSHARYGGALSEKGFQLRRIIYHRNSFLPNIRGQFEAVADGTWVHLTFALHPVVMVFLLFWLSMWYSISIPIMLSGLLTGELPPEMAVFFVAPLGMLAIFWASFWFEVNRSQWELTQIMQGNALVAPKAQPARWRWLQIGLSLVTAASVLWYMHARQQQPVVPSASFYSQSGRACAQQVTPVAECNFALAHTLSDHPAARALALNPDGTTLATGGKDKAIKLWDLQTGQLQRTLQSDSGVVMALAIAPDNQTVVSGSGDRMVRLWPLTTEQPPQLLPGHTGGINQVQVSADGTTVISGGYQGIRLWDRATGNLKQTLPDARDQTLQLGPITLETGSPRIQIFDLSADGKTALVELGSKVVVWNLDTQGQTPLPHQWFTHVNGAYLSPDGQTVVTTSYTQPKTYMKVWDLATGDLKAKVLLSSARESWGYYQRLAVSRDRIFVSTPDGLAVWDLHSGQLAALLEMAQLHHLVVNPDGTLVVGIAGDGDAGSAQIQIWQRA